MAASWRMSSSSIALVFAMLITPHAEAHTAKDDYFLELLEHENHVFSASRYRQTIAETPANVAILSREDIRRFGYRTVRQALATLPGIYDATSQWPALGVRGLAVPGDFGSRILTLINGMPVYEPTYGSFFIEHIDIESIDRIEFVKGAGSALYGSGAVLAVVNLITRNGRDIAGSTAQIDVGSHRAAKLYGAYGNKSEYGIDSFISASRSRDPGRDMYLEELDNTDFGQDRFHGVSAGNDSSDVVRLFGRFAYQDAWVQGVIVTADKRDPLASYGSVFNGRLQLAEQLYAVEAGINRELGSGALLTARTYYFAVAEKGDYPYTFSGERIPPTDYINVSDLSSRQIGAELRYDRFFANRHHILAGLEVKRVTSHQRVGDQPGPERSGVFTVDSRPAYQQWALFLQDELHLGPGTLFVGARYDAYSGFSSGVKSRLSPRIAYVYDLSANTTAKLMYGEAYRAPTIYESLYQDGMPAASTLWANPSLRPELARSLEALFEYQPKPGVKWKLSSFINRLTDSPVQVVMPELNGMPCSLGMEGCVQYQNSGATQQVAGIEANLRIRDTERDTVYTSIVLQRGMQNGSALTSSPRLQFKIGVSRALPPPLQNATLEAHAIGKALGRINPDGSRSASAPAYLRLNAALNMAPTPGGWRASVRIDNLLDQRIYTIASRELQPLERVPAEGRNVSVQLQLDF